MVEWHTNNYDHRFNVYLISLSITITRRTHVKFLEQKTQNNTKHINK